jgi:endoglucanase
MSLQHRARAGTLTAISLALLIVASQIVGTIPQASAVGLSIQASGNRLVDGNGQTVIPHGVNRSGTEFMCFENPGGFFDGPSDAASVQTIKSWTNVNVVRLPLNEDCWLGLKDGLNPAYVGANYRSAISSYVNLLTANGLYTILDLHWAASGTELANFGETPEFPNGRNPYPMADRQWSPQFWGSVADAFKDNPAVIFDLYNEPYPDNNQDSVAAWTCLRDGGTCGGMSFQAAGMQELVDAIRATGARNLIMVAGVGWAGIMSQWLSYKPIDPYGQLAASTHRYREAWCNTLACWNSELTPVAQQVPLITGEIGEEAADVNCMTAFVHQYRWWADAHSVPYLAWTWNTWPNYCLDLIASYDGTPSSPYGQDYKDHLASLPMVLSDNFDDGDANGWTLVPSGYWSVVSGEIKATGNTAGNWAWQSVYRSLPAGVASFGARIQTPASTPSNHGIVATTADEMYQVLFIVDNGNTLRWSTSIAGLWSGWTAVGSIDRTAVHTYAIRRNTNGTFRVAVDGVVKASNIAAGPPTAWAGGIAKGGLFTEAEQAGQVLNTSFDDVLAWH